MEFIKQHIDYTEDTDELIRMWLATNQNHVPSRSTLTWGPASPPQQAQVTSQLRPNESIPPAAPRTAGTSPSTTSLSKDGSTLKRSVIWRLGCELSRAGVSVNQHNDYKRGC
jgi:hypothetical protein